MSPETDDRRPVATVAKELGLPERSLFRAVEKGRVPSYKRDGVTVVSLADAESWAARRVASLPPPPPVQPPGTGSATATGALPAAAAMPGSLPTAHGSLAVGSGRTHQGSVLDGDQASALFAAFERGETPVELVQRLRLPPQLVLAAHTQYLQLRSATAPNSTQSRLDQLGLAVEEIRADLLGVMNGAAASASELRELADRVADLAAPSRATFKCSCGHAGLVASHVQCTSCGRSTTWGFFSRKG